MFYSSNYAWGWGRSLSLGVKMIFPLRRAVIRAALAGLSLVPPAVAHAAAPGPASLHYYAQSYGESVGATIAVSADTDVSGGTWAIRALPTYSPTLVVRELGTTDPQWLEDLSHLNASLTYDFVIQAASQQAFDAAVLSGILTVSGYTDLQADLGTTAYAFGNIFVAPTLGGVSSLYHQAECGYGGIECGLITFSEASGISAFADAGSLSFRGQVRLGAEVQSRVFGLAFPTQAIVDPILALSGTNLNLSDYSFSFSPGFGNVQGGGAVPEPSIWLQMILGFICVGAAMRTRRTLQPA